MTRWQETPFADILLDSKDGEWGQGEETVGHQLTEVIRGTDFLNLNNPTKELPKRWIKNHIVERKKLQPRDILLETAGGTATQSTGRSALLRKTFFEKHNAQPVLCSSFTRYLRLNQNSYCPEFIFYLLQALYKAGYMAVYNLQHTGVSRFQYTTFKNKTVLKLPSLEIQEKVAAILSAYDDLIENNRRRIALLEDLAEEIYREWFVRMRFPRHERVKVEKGVPEGWEIKKLPVIAEITYGFPFQSNRFNTEGLGKPIIRIRNIPESSTQDYTDEAVADKYIVDKGDLVVGMDGEFHINHWYGDEAYLVQRVCRLKAKNPVLNGYLAKAVYGPIKHYESILMGATLGHLGAKHLNTIDILVPPPEFNGYIDSFNVLAAQKLTFASSINTLKKSRDMLLPRLISGNLPVENLNIRFPPSMLDETEGEGTAPLAKDTTHAQLHLRRRYRAGNTKEAKA